jgi:hypothetical protein
MARTAKQHVVVKNIMPSTSDTLEIYSNGNDAWYRLMGSLLLVFVGCFLMVSLGAAGLVLGFFALLAGIPLSVSNYKIFKNKSPILTLTNDRLICSAWPFKYILYSDIERIENETIIKITVKDIEKHKGISTLEKLFNNNRISLNTNEIDFNIKLLVEIITEKLNSIETPLTEIITNYQRKPYTPNTVPTKKRTIHIILSLAIITHAGYGLIIGKLLIPAKRGRYLELHGFSAYIMLVALLLLVANLIATVIDHYDRQNNEDAYRKFKKISFRLGWSFWSCALISALIQLSVEFKCKNIIIDELEIGKYPKKVIVYNRYCAEINPMNDKIPSTFIATNQNIGDIESGKFGNIIARLNGCKIEKIEWNNNVISVQYKKADEHQPQNKAYAKADKRTPIPVQLIELKY